MSDKDDTVRDGRFLDTPNRRGSGHGIYSSFGSDRYHGHHHYHPYRRSDREYFSDQFKKAKPPTFDGEINNSQDAEMWMLRMNKFFKLHDYSQNVEAIIATFSLKGKANIWWEDVNNVRGIHEEELTWNEFERLFMKKYLSERYYDDKAK